MGPCVVLLTSAICGFLLPVAYIGWLVLNNRPRYLGADMPVGSRAIIFNTPWLRVSMVLASVTYSTAVGLGGCEYLGWRSPGADTKFAIVEPGKPLLLPILITAYQRPDPWSDRGWGATRQCL